MKTFCLLLASLLCVGLATADDETPTFAPKTQAVVVGPEGTVSLKHGWFEGWRGAHLLLLSSLEEPNWQKVQAGETRLVIYVHGKVEPGHYTTAGSSEAVGALFQNPELNPAQAFAAILYTNTSKSEPVLIGKVLEQAQEGKHLLTRGAITVKGAPRTGFTLEADFAFVFDGASVAGRVHVAPE